MKVFLTLLLFGFVVGVWSQSDPYKRKVEGSGAPRMGNRFFVKNTLLEVFGNNEHHRKIIDKNFFKAGESVGGPCDICEQVYHQPEEVFEPESECVGGKGVSKVAHFPKTNILRTTHLIKTYTGLVLGLPEDQEIFKGNILEKSSYAFYPYGGDIEIRKSLQKKAPFNSLELKKEVLLTYCLSPQWQSL